jgi:HK97 gp10 family phage protein
MMVEVKIEGIDNVLASLKSLPPEVVSNRGGPVKKALRKAAQVIRKQAIANLDKIINGVNVDGDSYSTGLLRKSIVVTRGKKPIDTKGERYLVRVKRRAYPKQSGKRTVTTLKTAHLLEYGATRSNRQPARPWLRPAAIAKKDEAINVAVTELVKDINNIKKKLGFK